MKACNITQLLNMNTFINQSAYAYNIFTPCFTTLSNLINLSSLIILNNVMSLNYWIIISLFRLSHSFFFFFLIIITFLYLILQFVDLCDCEWLTKSNGLCKTKITHHSCLHMTHQLSVWMVLSLKLLSLDYNTPY